MEISSEIANHQEVEAAVMQAWKKQIKTKRKSQTKKEQKNRERMKMLKILN